MTFLWSKKPLFEETKTKPRSLLQKSRDERYLEKCWNFSTPVKWHFNSLKSLLLRNQHNQTTKPRSPLQKRRRKRCMEFLIRIMVTKPRSLLQKGMFGRYLEFLTRIIGYPLWKYSSFSAIGKWHFYRLNSLLLKKIKHHQTTKPSSLLQKSKLAGYLEFLTRIIV